MNNKTLRLIAKIILKPDGTYTAYITSYWVDKPYFNIYFKKEGFKTKRECKAAIDEVIKKTTQVLNPPIDKNITLD